MLTFILLCLLVGSVVGFLAGLFGIGGGLIIVPTLVYLLPMVGVPEPLLMSTALGTSFATIVITGFSSAQRHHKLGNIVWRAVKVLAPMVMIRSLSLVCLLANLIVMYQPKIFACLVVYLAAKMVISIKKKHRENQTFNNTSFCYWWYFNWDGIKRSWRRRWRFYRAIFKFPRD